MEEKLKSHDQKMDRLHKDLNKQMDTMNTLIADNYNQQTTLSEQILESVDNIEVREEERAKCQAASFDDMKNTMYMLFNQQQSAQQTVGENIQSVSVNYPSTTHHTYQQAYQPETPRSAQLGENFRNLEILHSTQETSEDRVMGDEEDLADADEEL